jgi:hypothetical protein
MPQRDRKEKDGLGQVVEITKDYLLDKVEEAPLSATAAAATLAFKKLKEQQQLKKFLAQGGGVAQARLAAPSVSKFPTVGRVMVKGSLGPASAVGAAVEGAKTLYLIGQPEAREGHAEAGEELLRKPKVSQAANIALNTADAMSKYGAAMEARDIKRFREENNIPATYPDMMTREETRAMEERKGKEAKDIREILNRDNYGKRADGTQKGVGWLREQRLPDGSVATEYSTQSDAVKVDGKRIDFPSLVPTLTAKELRQMTGDIIPNKKPIPEEVMQKAIDHARAQLAAKKSVFYGG